MQLTHTHVTSPGDSTRGLSLGAYDDLRRGGSTPSCDLPHLRWDCSYAREQTQLYRGTANSVPHPSPVGSGIRRTLCLLEPGETEASLATRTSSFAAGPIAPELGNLTSLEILHLWKNQLSGASPRSRCNPSIASVIGNCPGTRD